MSIKYKGLPDIVSCVTKVAHQTHEQDSAPDVFETPDEPEIALRPVSGYSFPRRAARLMTERVRSRGRGRTAATCVGEH